MRVNVGALIVPVCPSFAGCLQPGAFAAGAWVQAIANPKVLDEAALVAHMSAVSDLVRALQSNRVTAPPAGDVLTKPGPIPNDVTRLAAALATLDNQEEQARVCGCVTAFRGC